MANSEISCVNELTNNVYFPEIIVGIPGETNSLDVKFKNYFEFVSNPIKMGLLHKVNENLRIKKNGNNKIIFIYSAPKVGSTSLVSSLRLFVLDSYDIIHVHDEEMLKILGHVEGITINEIIFFNKYIGKDVYVIDVYRSPIERKISTYFEKIGAYHFNNSDEKVNNYNVDKIINRFNNIFPYIGNGDHFLDKYNIPIPDNFDYEKQYLLINIHDIKFIKLRLKDSNRWGPILTNIFETRICVIKDYETTNKPIKYLYSKFKSQYKIPKNILDTIMSCKYLKYFYNELEIKEYYDKWLCKSTTNFDSYTREEYKIYETISGENSHIDYIQTNHYFDEGCICQACKVKRAEISLNIIRGINVTERLVHQDAKQEYIEKKIDKVQQIIKQMPPPPQKLQNRGKNFQAEMNRIIGGKKF